MYDHRPDSIKLKIFLIQLKHYWYWCILQTACERYKISGLYKNYAIFEQLLKTRNIFLYPLKIFTRVLWNISKYFQHG